MRGSLDVLLATPLSTDRIVLSKWWGIYRVVPAVALLPAVAAVLLAATEPTVPPYRMAFAAGFTPIRVSGLDRIAHGCLPMAMLLVQGALVTSVGLLLATWIQRVGRAVAVSVVNYICYAFGWLVVLEMGIITDLLVWLGLLRPNDSEDFVEWLVASASPLGAQLGRSWRTSCPRKAGVRSMSARSSCSWRLCWRP